VWPTHTTGSLHNVDHYTKHKLVLAEHKRPHQSVGLALSKPGRAHTKKQSAGPLRGNNGSTHLCTLQRTHTLRQCGAHTLTSQHTQPQDPQHKLLYRVGTL
jgi:hypothetical protein